MNKADEEIKAYISECLADFRLTRKLSEKRRDRDQLLGHIFAYRDIHVFLFNEDLPNPEVEKIKDKDGKLHPLDEATYTTKEEAQEALDEFFNSIR